MNTILLRNQRLMVLPLFFDKTNTYYKFKDLLLFIK